MRSHVHVFRIIFFVFCLCAFGSTKSSNTFDFSKSTTIQAEEDGLAADVDTVTKGQPVVFVTPPQPRNSRGEFLCTSNRYIPDERQIGKASWYGGSFHGKETASGERFDQDAYTLAHLTLPMGTEVLVENPESKVVIKARVNDCGPFIAGRIADLSRGLAKDLGLLNRGGGTVILTVL